MKPFEVIGSPWLNAYKLADKMNSMHLPGVIFRSVFFEPFFSKHKGIQCRGVQVHITDYRAVKPVVTGIRLMQCIRDQDPGKFEWVPPIHEKGEYFIDLLAGGDELRLRLQHADELLEKWSDQSRQFKELKEKCHLY